MNILKLWQLLFVQTEIKPAERQVGKLKLSEAIRAGCKLSPPNDGLTFFSGGTCAIGAAYEAVFGCKDPTASYSYERVRQYFDISMNDWVDWNISSRFSSGQTREQIADFLESQGR